MNEQGSIQEIAERLKVIADMLADNPETYPVIALAFTSAMSRLYQVEDLKAENARLRAALERIRNKVKEWEGQSDVPFWNLGDIAAAALATPEKEQA